MLAKFAAYFITRSNAVFSDALESIVNVVASGFAFYSIYLSSLPKDENHPYGHGKVEFFSAFLEGGLIFIAGLLIIGKSIYGIFFPEEIQKILDGMGILAAAGIINYMLGVYLIRKSRTFHSMTLYADGKHLQTDAYSTLGLLIGLGLYYLTKVALIDVLLSLGIGLYILYSGYILLRKSIGGLMDESDREMVTNVIEILQRNRKDVWIDIHNLRVQRYGPSLHIDCHLTLPNYYNLGQVHDEVSAIDQLVDGNIEVPTEFFIHADPCLPQCCHYCRVKNCPIRSEVQSVDLHWDLTMVTKNQKHFDSLQDKGFQKGVSNEVF